MLSDEMSGVAAPDRQLLVARIQCTRFGGFYLVYF